MKVKLLKKIRKRFSITHYPEGFRNGSEYYNHNLIKLTDSSRWYYMRWAQVDDLKKEVFSDHSFATEKECIDYLKSLIIDKLRDEGHRGRKDRKIKEKQIKVWYV